MKSRRALSFLVAGVFSLTTSQTGHGAREERPNVVPDLEQRLGKFRQVLMPFDASALSAHERKMVEKLVDACRYLDSIYWRQVDPEGLELYQSLDGKTDQQSVALQRYLWINGSRFDLLDGEKA